MGDMLRFSPVQHRLTKSVILEVKIYWNEKRVGELTLGNEIWMHISPILKFGASWFTDSEVSVKIEEIITDEPMRENDQP